MKIFFNICKLYNSQGNTDSNCKDIFEIVDLSFHAEFEKTYCSLTWDINGLQEIMHLLKMFIIIRGEIDKLIDALVYSLDLIFDWFLVYLDHQ